MGIFNTIISEISWISYEVRKVLDPLLLFAMVGLAIATVVVILMQKGTAEGIGTIGGGESETYMGKNKGQSKERRMKVLTMVLGGLLVVVSILYFLFQIK